MVNKALEGEGLRGQTAGQTALCTVETTGGLTYRGYAISDLAQHATYEEVAHLLLYGKLPNQQELDDYLRRLQTLRQLPAPLKTALELIPASAHPMDVMRSGCSILGNLETEHDFSEQLAEADRLLSALPAILCYWYRFSHDGVRIETDIDDGSIAAHFLHMLHGHAPEPLHEQVMQCSLILYAEHEFNASTFCARVCASTLADLHSCITAGIGTLRGPLHGGANEKAMEMLATWRDPEQAEAAILQMLANGDKVMGFGHAIYRTVDPRNALIKRWAQKLSEQASDGYLYPIAERVEQVMWREKELFANADFYHGPAYHFMGIPTKLFTPLFACARTAGWSAHVMEQRDHNRIIRPMAEYIGPEPQQWLPIDKRP